MNKPTVTLPARPFFYTLDQVATMLGVTEATLKSRYVYFHGHSLGRPLSDMLSARSISKVGEPPDFRISEEELIRWLKRNGYRVYDRARLRQ